MEELFGLDELEATISDIVESDAFRAIIYVIVAYIVLIWLASAFWAYRDMRLRSASAITPYVAALAIILFTPVFFLFGLLLYRIIRPKETIAEVNERALAEEAMLAEVESHAELRQLRAARPRGLDHLPLLPQPAAARLPQLRAPDRARLDAVRLVRQGLRACRRSGHDCVHALRPPDSDAAGAGPAHAGTSASRPVTSRASAATPG